MKTEELIRLMESIAKAKELDHGVINIFFRHKECVKIEVQEFFGKPEKIVFN